MDREEAGFYAYVAECLAKHPDWLKTAFLAMADGMAKAIQVADNRAATYHMGMLCALTLSAPERINADTKALLNKKILEALPLINETEIERKARERLTKERV